jgi:ferritin-like metal-binding protein YciE
MPTTKRRNNGTSKRQYANADMSPALTDFFYESLKDIYWAEKHLIKALTKMEKAATNDQLKEAFADHRGQTENHVSRLEDVFDSLGRRAVAKKCEAMQGIIEEGEEAIDETEKGTSTRDVALILAAQKAEHYEIATYGGLAQLAETLGYEDIKGRLGETLDEEKETDELLTRIAQESINYEASQELAEA